MEPNTHISVDINKMKTEVCQAPRGDGSICGWWFFRERTILKRIPAVLAARPEDLIVPVRFWACDKCGMPHHDTKGDTNPPAVESQVSPPSHLKIERSTES